MLERMRHYLPRLGWPRPTVWAALGFCGIALVSALIHRFSEAADDWAPNITTEALSLAATVVVLEWILRREARARLAPRVQRAEEAVERSYYSLVGAIGADYAETHVSSYVELPADDAVIIERWLSTQDERDADRPIRAGRPSLLTDASITQGQLDRIRARDAEVLEPRLVAAIDELSDKIALATSLHGLSQVLTPDDETHQQDALARIVAATENFRRVVAAQPGITLAVPEYAMALIRGHRMIALEAHGAADPDR